MKRRAGIACGAVKITLSFQLLSILDKLIPYQNLSLYN